MVYVVSCSCLYHAARTLYEAYYAVGAMAFVFALIGYVPFVVSLARMAWRDTETRRMIFYKNCMRLWGLIIYVDLWVTFAIDPESYSMCLFITRPRDTEIINQYLGLDELPNFLFHFLCKQRLKLTWGRTYFLQHLKFGFMLLLAKRHWTNKHQTRLKTYKKDFITRLMQGQVEAEDWPQILENPQALAALGPNFNHVQWSINAILRRTIAINSLHFFENRIKS